MTLSTFNRKRLNGNIYVMRQINFNIVASVGSNVTSKRNQRRQSKCVIELYEQTSSSTRNEPISLEATHLHVMGCIRKLLNYAPGIKRQQPYKSRNRDRKNADLNLSLNDEARKRGIISIPSRLQASRNNLTPQYIDSGVDLILLNENSKKHERLCRYRPIENI